MKGGEFCTNILTWPGVRLGKVGELAQHVVHQLLSEGLVSGFRKERLLFKDGEKGHGLLEHVNARLKSEHH